MKSQIFELVTAALDTLAAEGLIDAEKRQLPVVERTREASHGHSGHSGHRVKWS